MAHHVGDGFAQGEREDAFLHGGEAGRFDRGFDRDAGGFERGAGLFELAFEAHGAIAADGGAYLRQRVARDALDVADLFGGALGLGGGETGSELGFQNDQR